MDKNQDRLREKKPDSDSSESVIKEVIRSLQQIERQVEKLTRKEETSGSSRR